MITTLSFVSPDLVSDASVLLVVGRRARLQAPAVRALLSPPVAAVWDRILDDLPPGDGGASSHTWTGADRPMRVACCTLPELCSRHNSPARPHAVANLIKKEAPGKGDVGILLALDDSAHALATVAAVTRCFPEFTRKREDPNQRRTVRVALLGPDGPLAVPPRVERASESVRMAARLVDMPTEELHTDAFIDIATRLALALPGVRTTLIRGEALKEGGFGGLWGVGKAATHGPALLALHWEPEGARRTVAWVGKGIVYDTGGLSLKTKDGMPGMKGDMAGAAAVLGAFVAAVSLQYPERLHAVLCLAENAVGPESQRPDDVIRLYSGRTVEVNNTDAEGRLVLADGVAWVARAYTPEVIVDLATLTGAQMVATGKRHAAIVTNDEAMEIAAVRAGRSSGDLVHPLPWAPEFFRREFRSEIADMKNSVKDRNNAQTSCAALFIAEHLGEWRGRWLHVDMAGTADVAERATGFGIPFLLDLFDVGRP